MLILSRHVTEKIRIKTPEGRVIWIELTNINRGRSWLGFTADKDVTIDRMEVLDGDEQFPPMSK